MAWSTATSISSGCAWTAGSPMDRPRVRLVRHFEVHADLHEAAYWTLESCGELIQGKILAARPHQGRHVEFDSRVAIDSAAPTAFARTGPIATRACPPPQFPCFSQGLDGHYDLQSLGEHNKNISVPRSQHPKLDDGLLIHIGLRVCAPKPR